VRQGVTHHFIRHQHGVSFGSTLRDTTLAPGRA
jgi:hypothetical protein